MGKGWRAARAMLGSNFLCVNPRSGMDREEVEASALPSPSPIRRSSSTPRESSKGTCAICLEWMNSKAGVALFTAECAHMFHFSCIASNVKHGNMVCPVCRSRWRDVPWKQDSVAGAPTPRRPAPATFFNELPLRTSSPEIYNDDEECAPSPSIDQEPLSVDGAAELANRAPTISTFSESSSVAASESRDEFTILVNLRAPAVSSSLTSKAPVDLITVLDVSGSMSGSKLQLLKSAMEFVISQLGDRDRLCVIVFSTAASRLFPLKRMSSSGKSAATRSIRSLRATGATNIDGGLKLAARVLQQRRSKNPVAGVMLLSDGQDTSSSSGVSLASGWRSSGEAAAAQLPPIHAFGFGSDHDPATMHAVAESSGGTFNFIRAESSVRDAFAQCIGGLLSVVSQGVQLIVDCYTGSSRVIKVEKGGFASRIVDNGSSAVLEVGDVYAEEERDVLLQLRISPVAGTSSGASTSSGSTIAVIRCKYRDAMQPGVELETIPKALAIQRPPVVDPSDAHGSVEVERQRSRVLASAAIAAAWAAADGGNFSGAQVTLEECRRRILSSAAFVSGDALATALHGELGEVMAKMENRRIFQESGRAYALSAHSSHLTQRATSRPERYGDSYLTSTMAEMVHLSQTFDSPPPPPPQPAVVVRKEPPPPPAPRVPTLRLRSRSSRKVNPHISP